MCQNRVLKKIFDGEKAPAFARFPWTGHLLCSGLIGLGLLALHGALVLWMAQAVGQGMPSDDALFLSRGLLHFSVLQFSPHWPGYPGLMALGRMLLPWVENPQQTLAFLSVASAALLPVAMAWAAWAHGGRALVAYGLGVTQPLLAGLGISLLSDGPGMLFIVVACALAGRPQGGWRPGSQAFLSGAALGIALACRPSYGVVIALIGLALLAVVRSCPCGAKGSALRWRVAFVIGGCCVVVPAFGVVFALEGQAYWTETLRFMAGHTTLWGQTAWSDIPLARSWADTLRGLPWGVWWASAAILAGSISLFYHRPAIRRWRSYSAFPWILGWGGALIWTLLMQNPSNPRHLAPVLSLGSVLLGLAGPASQPVSLSLSRRIPWRSWLPWGIWGCLLLAGGFQGLSLSSTLRQATAAPPVQQVVSTLAHSKAGTKQDSPLIISNHAVHVLRQAMPDTVIVDAYYRASASSALRLAPGVPAYWVRSTALADPHTLLGPDSGQSWTLFRLIPGRAWGEPTLWLYQRTPGRDR